MLTWLNHGTREQHQIMGIITAKTKYNSTLSDNVSTSESRTRFVKINLQKCITLKRMHQLTILGHRQCETMELKNENHCYWTIWETYCMFCADKSLYPQSPCAYSDVCVCMYLTPNSCSTHTHTHPTCGWNWAQLSTAWLYLTVHAHWMPLTRETAHINIHNMTQQCVLNHVLSDYTTLPYCLEKYKCIKLLKTISSVTKHLNLKD